ncbi:unnamed protein product [Rhodiola kirilowii]
MGIIHVLFAAVNEPSHPDPQSFESKATKFELTLQAASQFMAAATNKSRFCIFTTTSIISITLFLSSLHNLTNQIPIRHGPDDPPSFAYYISGGQGDNDRVLRLLLAVYHPRNRYLLHLGTDASDDERGALADLIELVPAIRAFRNVDVMGKPNRINYMGSTNIADTLRAVAILLKIDHAWNWFIQLSPSDYPLVTQDDLAYVFSSIGRNYNFIDHTRKLGWKEAQRVQPIIVDPALYLARKSQIFQATQRRPTPNAFTFFTGSPWAILSRQFLQFCIFGYDNLPRTMLMYFSTSILSQESYFHSVICNAPQFKNTTINSDLRFTIWDKPPKAEPHYLTTADYEQMVQSGAVFARQFERDSPVLDLVDNKILNRGKKLAAPGAWCTGWFTDLCARWGDVNLVKPGPQAKKLKNTTSNLVASSSNQCR